MTKHLQSTTHIQFPEDRDILTRKLFDVNIRLYESCDNYREIVNYALDYLKYRSATQLEGYKKPHGMSGANLGIPWNIIAYQTRDGTEVMINPRITARYGDKIKSESNCGSLTLDAPITIERDEFIDVEYYCPVDKTYVTLKKVRRVQGGFTIQHEVEHNLGILITDK